MTQKQKTKQNKNKQNPHNTQNLLQFESSPKFAIFLCYFLITALTYWFSKLWVSRFLIYKIEALW